MAAPYVKRYPGGFLDKPNLTTPVDSAFLNAVESALLQLLGETPLADEVGVWVGGAGGGLVYQKLTNAQIAAGAAIDKSKLGALNIGDADVAAAAGIAKSKLGPLNIANADVVAGAAIALNKLGFSGSVDQVTRGDGTYGRMVYRKITSKTVNNSVDETDLLNGEITIGANAIGAGGLARIFIQGQILNNTGASQSAPRFKLKLGATTIMDTNALVNLTSSGTPAAFIMEGWIHNLATNSQYASMKISWIGASGGITATTFLTGQGYGYADTPSGGVGVFTYQGSGSSAEDTTAGKALVFSVINGVASASYETVLKSAVVEIA